MIAAFSNPAVWPVCIVAGLLSLAGALRATSKIVPPGVSDVVSICAALVVSGLSLLVAARIGDHALTYWIGGWTPRNGRAIGIAFSADRAGAGAAAFAGLMFAAAIWFARGHFAGARNSFHVFMLLFLAAHCGFFYTHDLFDLFVWFEMMSVAAFALTGYALRPSALDGALNFTVINTIGSYLILMGIALAYCATNALDFSAVKAVAQMRQHDPLLIASFVLTATGFLTKAAQFPFHFWLPDAHAVAPSPVSVIFSGVMVSVGLFGVIRMIWDVFGPCPTVQHLAHVALLGMGAASVVVGAVMALMQRHVKRLLAFSTLSHVGIALIGISLLGHHALGGALLYLLGHGAIKGALFMIAGIMLSVLGGVDELGLRGAGRAIWPAGVVMAGCGLVLAGIPVGPLDAGVRLIDAQARSENLHWLALIIGFAGALTGGAVLRVACRVFFGLGPLAGEEHGAPTDDEREQAERPFYTQLMPVLALVMIWAGAALWPDLMQSRALQAARDLMDGVADTPLAPRRAVFTFMTWLPAVAAILLAAFDLNRHRLPPRLVRGMAVPFHPIASLLQTLHDGVIGEYVVWMMSGLVLLATVAAL